MVICKFFLQGTCKFGDYCKFDHQINDTYNNYQPSTSILRQSHFGNSQQQQPQQQQQRQQGKIVPPNPAVVDVNTLVKSVVNDMTTTEKGGQWLLSCYGPFKEKPNFPGFDDYSFEEIRFGYYEAVKNGNVEQYKQQVQMLLQQAVMRMKSLQTPSPDVVNVIKQIYNTPTNTLPGTTGFSNPNQQPFGQQSSPSIFAQANQNTFGQSIPQQNQFGGASSNIFGGQTGGSIFGNAEVPPQNAGGGIFRQANSNLSPQNSIFGGQATSQTGSIFGGAPPQYNPNTVFANNFNPQNANSFGQGTPNIFVTPPSSEANPAVFNKQNPGFLTVDAKSYSRNVFGGPQAAPENNSVRVQEIDETVYSKMEELTAEEMKWFESDDLDVFNIPEKPPTFQMCFKT